MQRVARILRIQVLLFGTFWKLKHSTTCYPRSVESADVEHVSTDSPLYI